MPLLHEPAIHSSIRSRIEHLSPDAMRRWGKMSADQMLWHCNQVLRTSLGDIQVGLRKLPLPRSALKFMLFNMPWPHGAPTAPEYQAVESHAFEAEREQCLQLIDRFTARGLDQPGWGRAAFGDLTGPEWSRLQAKHLDFHLGQFSG